MVKWLQRFQNSSARVTDDPLAALNVHSKLNQVYTVNRVNPLYVEDEDSGVADDLDNSSVEKRYEKIKRSQGFLGGETHPGAKSKVEIIHRENLEKNFETKVNKNEEREEKDVGSTSGEVHEIRTSPSSSGFFEPSQRIHENDRASNHHHRSPDENALVNVIIISTGSLKPQNFYASEHASFKSFFRRDKTFTLDEDRAERLIRHLRRKKKGRLICRLLTLLLSLLVFIMCVVLVSLLITNGKRSFGSF